MSLASEAFSTLRRIVIVIAAAVAFLFGAVGTVYLSLRSSEVTVPNIVGKDRFVAENELKEAGLNFRVRATRPSNQANADTVLFQLPRAGEVVKTGQTVAVDVSRVAKEGEASDASASVNKAGSEKGNENKNTNEAVDNANETKPKRNKNRNDNANSNANNGNAGNRNTNRTNANNRNANSNRNANTGDNNNRRNETENTNARPVNRNVNRTPTPTEPAPHSSNTNRPPR